MPAPDTIDMSGGDGPWPAFLLSGVEGSGAALLNGEYRLVPPTAPGEWKWRRPDGAAEVRTPEGYPGLWDLVSTDGSPSVEFTAEGGWPWTTTWAPDGSHTGDLVFQHALAPPVTVELAGAEATVQAKLTTVLTGANNDLVITAVPPGRAGNSIRIRYVAPGTNNAALSVAVSVRDITVNLATDGAAAITSTAALVKAALEASPAAAALVTAADAAGNNGSGVVTALAWTSLSGGTGGLPLPPVTVTP